MIISLETSMRKRKAVDEWMKAGIIADNDDVRLALMQKVHSGEITLEQAQDQLKKIKKNAKKNGQLTKAQAFSRG
jgi:phosphosulfolactate phosphohydrolase-like enzyme